MIALLCAAISAVAISVVEVHARQRRGEKNILSAVSATPQSDITAATFEFDPDFHPGLFAFSDPEMSEDFGNLLAAHSEIYEHRQWGFRCRLFIEFSDDSYWSGDAYVFKGGFHIVIPSANPTEGYWPTHKIVVPEKLSDEFTGKWSEMLEFIESRERVISNRLR